jgi:pimeloyl-ACP methyl ester carboxylesterase
MAVLTLLAGVELLFAYRDRRRFQPPGSLLNGFHVLKLGEGVPAVVFEAGIANSCLAWSLIQPPLARQTTTYSYDRAGLGWSAPQPGRCSLEQITQDLHALLDSLSVPRPVILVGHSFGGYVVRSFTHHFPGEVAGLVLVDPATPEEWMNPTPQQRWRLRRAIFFTRAAGLLAYFGIVRLGLWLLLRRKQDGPGPSSGFSQTLQRIRFEVRKIPNDMLPLIRCHWSRPGFFWAMAAHLQAVPTCARAASQCGIPAHLPVAVLSGAHQPPQRLAEHAAMATRHIMASGSRHFIHLDEPELVVGAIEQLLEASS